jgi:flagellar biosynthesis/type III secretory pathway protein FliH
MEKIERTEEQREKTLAIVLPDVKERQKTGAQNIILRCSPAQRARLDEMVGALSRRAEGRRLYNRSQVVRYALDALYCDIMSVNYSDLKG